MNEGLSVVARTAADKADDGRQNRLYRVSDETDADPGLLDAVAGEIELGDEAPFSVQPKQMTYERTPYAEPPQEEARGRKGIETSAPSQVRRRGPESEVRARVQESNDNWYKSSLYESLKNKWAK